MSLYKLIKILHYPKLAIIFIPILLNIFKGLMYSILLALIFFLSFQRIQIATILLHLIS